MQRFSRQQITIVLALLTLYFVWGSTFLGMRIAIDSFPPFMMAGLRFSFAGAALYAVLRLRGSAAPSWIQWRNAAMIGTLLVVCGNAGVAFAEQWVATSVAALVIATVPLWASVFSALWGEPPHQREWMGIILGMVGVGMLNLGGSLQGSPVGAAVLLMAAMGWAFGSVWSKRLSLPEGLMSSAAQMLTAGLILLGISVVSGEHLAAPPSAKSLWAMAYLVVFGSFIAFSAYLYLLKTVRPMVATSYAFVNPLVAMLLGNWLVGEVIGWQELAAMVAILIGVVLVLFGQQRLR